MAQVAAISHTGAQDVVAFSGVQPVSAARFLADVQSVAGQLPERAYLVNFCLDSFAGV